MAIATEEIKDGVSNSAVEVIVEDRNGTPVLRSVVSLSVAPMLPQS